MLLGYANRLSVEGGESLDIKVSAGGAFETQLVRLRGMADDGSGPRVAEDSLPEPSNGEHNGRVQPLRSGSHVDVRGLDLDASAGLVASFWVKPTRPGGTVQTLLDAVDERSEARFRVELDAGGRLVLRLGGGATGEAELRGPVLRKDEWRYLTAAFEPETRRLRLSIEDRRGDGATLAGEVSASVSFRISRLLIGARLDANGHGADGFNGCVADPAIFDGAETLLARWDFSRKMREPVAIDIGGGGFDGQLVNRPARAILGPFWDKKTVRWSDDPKQWNALHFHDDDLDDAGWETSFTVIAPRESGIYAVRLSRGPRTYHVPFYVRAGAQRNRVLFVAPTNTYLAYGNEHLWEGERGVAHQKMMSFPIVLDAAEETLLDEPRLGRSLYDRHSDDSGVIYASRLRPLTNLQPNYRNWLAGGPRHFSADFFVTGWLDSIGIGFDVATDEDVDREGAGLLAKYDVVLTGSHPEYPTTAGFDAFETYAFDGGRIMYLGANGFFWITSFADEARNTIEVRRGYAAQRNWTSHPAELFHSSTGEMGGAFRHRGRDQNPVFGIGMAAAGWGPASGYRRTAESYDDAVAWAFAGIGTEMLGQHGYLLGGAAGDELDQADPSRGTPASTVVLMSSRHDDFYFPSLDAVTEVGPRQQGSTNPNVRSDVVLVAHPGGGEVFSAGSICWAGSLGTNGYDNDIARLTTNVLLRFLASTDSGVGGR